jgi:hypothetical protein
MYWHDINRDKTGLSLWNLYTQRNAKKLYSSPADIVRHYESNKIDTANLNLGHLETVLQRHSNPCVVALVNAALMYDV